MKVEVVAGQIGPDGDVELETVDALQAEGVGGDLHDCHLPPAVGELGEQQRQVGRLRCGANGTLAAARQRVRDGSEDAVRHADRPRDPADQIGHRALAVGPGDPNHPEAALGVPGKRPGRKRRGPSRIGRGEPGGRRPGVAVGEHRHCAALQRCGCELDPVVPGAGERGEHPPGLNRLRHVRDAGGVRTGAAKRRPARGSELDQRHTLSPLVGCTPSSVTTRAAMRPNTGAATSAAQ